MVRKCVILRFVKVNSPSQLCRICFFAQSQNRYDAKIVLQCATQLGAVYCKSYSLKFVRTDEGLWF